MARKKKFPKGKSMIGVGVLNELKPQNDNFVIKIRSLIDANPEVMANQTIMKFLELALFRANEGEPVNEVAKTLDDELSGYLVKNNFKAPQGIQELQTELKHYTEIL